jgi:hypothetical protein
VLEQLPERDRPPIKRRLTQAWQQTDYAKALDQLNVSRSSSSTNTPAPPPHSERAWKKH